MAGKKLSAQQVRDRRAKIMLAVLGVVFVGVLALELPKVMGGGGSHPSATPPATTTTSTAGASAPATPASSTPALASAPSQLTHFSRFAAKDPFRAQAGTGTAAGGGSSAPSKQPAATPTPPKAQPKQKPADTLTITMSQKPVLPSGPRVPAALLLVGGKRKVVVALNAEFPKKNPLFRVVALSQNAIWIELIGGSLANGESTIKLEKGRRLTLADTTLGVKLTLALVKPTTAPAPAVTPASTTPTTTAPATTTPASPATTPTTTTTG